MAETGQSSDDRHGPATSDDLGAAGMTEDQPNSHDFFHKSVERNGPCGRQVAPGDRIGAYQIVSQLGEGGMGEVWLARHVQLEVERAIKLLRRFVSADRQWRSRMLREARILAKLNHPNIAALYEFIDEPSGNCIVLERVIGRTLDQLMNGRPLPLGQALDICRQIAEALHYAHSQPQPVVHRDLKPRNVIIREDGVVKVLDWGIAQVLRAAKPTDAAHARKTHRRGVAGTPGYMSPEQACGKQADRRADIWALGCLLYEMLCGTPAFPHKELDSFVDAVMAPDGGEPDWTRLPAGLPDEIEDLLRHCLERDLRRRFDGTDCILAALRYVSDADTQDLSEAGRQRKTGNMVPRPPVVPSNIPPAMTSFIGRERVMEQVRNKLRQSRMVTLIGPGGTGKTALAMQLARSMVQHGLDNGSEHVSGGIWLAELASVSDPDLVGQTIAAVLRGRAPQGSGRDAIDEIAAAVGQRNTLLIVDNCEHLCDGCRDTLAVLLRRCPAVSVLATSRQRLGVPGEQVIRVPPLSIPDERQHWTSETIQQFESVRLFIERATETRYDFAITDRNTIDVARICRILDGLPLAIELAAARVGAIAVGQLAERLSNVFPVLDRSGHRPVGHGGTGSHMRALEATIRWSYDLLSDHERRLFRRLAVFRGGWTLEAAEAILTDEGGDSTVDQSAEAMHGAHVDEQGAQPLQSESVVDLMAGLVEKSLVVFEELDGWPRYRLYEAVRHFAENMLRQEEDADSITQFNERHAQYFLELAGEFKADDPGPKQAVALERIEQDHDNLRAAMEWALTRRDQPDLAIELAYRLHWFYFVRGYSREGLRWLRAALAHRPARNDLMEGRACNAVGMLFTLLNDNDSAQRSYEQCLEILRNLEGEDRRVAAVLNNLGMLAQIREDRQAAFEAYEQAVAIYDRLNDPVGRARVQLNIAALNLMTDRLAEAKAQLDESMEIIKSKQDEVRTAEIHQLLCEIAEREGRREDAIVHLRESTLLRSRNREYHAILRNFVFAAAFAVDGGGYETGVRLLAYIGRRYDADDADLPNRLRARMELMLNQCREKLGEVQYQQFFADGASLSRSEVCQLALSVA